MLASSSTASSTEESADAPQASGARPSQSNANPVFVRVSGRFSRTGVGSMRSLGSLYSGDNNNNSIRMQDPAQLSSRYRIVQTLSSGASTVHVVRRQEDARLLVLKVCKQSEAASRELALLRSLRHASIVRVHDSFILESSGAMPSRLCLVMDYAAGGDLQQLIDRLRADREAASAAGRPGAQGLHDEQCTRILVQLISAAAHCHAKGVVHRDIKPANIFLARAPNAASLVFLGDFGISAQLPMTDTTACDGTSAKCTSEGCLIVGESSTCNQAESPSALAGTPYYLAPELLVGAPFSPKSDVWSIGIVLYQMLTLELPFVGRSLPQLAMKIRSGHYETPRGKNAELLHLLRSCLTAAPSARPDARAILNLPALAEWRRYYAARRLRDAADHYLSPQMYTPPTRTATPRGWRSYKPKGTEVATTSESLPGPTQDRARRVPSGFLGKAMAVGHDIVSSPRKSSPFSTRNLFVRTASCASEDDGATSSVREVSPSSVNLPLEKEAAVWEMRECLNCLQELAQGEWLESDRGGEDPERHNHASSPSRLPIWGRSSNSPTKSAFHKKDSKRDNNTNDASDPRCSNTGRVSWVEMEKEVYVQPYAPNTGVSSSTATDTACDGELFERGVAVFLCYHAGKMGRLYVTGAHVIFSPLFGRSHRSESGSTQSTGRIVLPLKLIQCLIRGGRCRAELTLMLAPPLGVGNNAIDGPPPTKAFRALTSASRQAAIDAIVAAVAAHGLRLSVYTRRNVTPQKIRQALDSYQAGRVAPEQIRKSFEKLWQRSGLSDISSRLSTATPAFRGSIRRSSTRDSHGCLRSHTSSHVSATASSGAAATVHEEKDDGEHWSNDEEEDPDSAHRV